MNIANKYRLTRKLNKAVMIPTARGDVSPMQWCAAEVARLAAGGVRAVISESRHLIWVDREGQGVARIPGDTESFFNARVAT